MNDLIRPRSTGAATKSFHCPKVRLQLLMMDRRPGLKAAIFAQDRDQATSRVSGSLS
jgi:hypothetical protein